MVTSAEAARASRQAAPLAAAHKQHKTASPTAVSAVHFPRFPRQKPCILLPPFPNTYARGRGHLRIGEKYCMIFVRFSFPIFKEFRLY